MHHKRIKNVLFGLLLVLLAGSLGAQQEPVTTLDVQAHRGASGLLPENSVAAFDKALELGVTTLELDVQVTRDRVLVVHHDARPNRKRCVHDDGRKVSKARFTERLYDDLATIDCGRRPHVPTQEPRPGTRIPRLEDVLVLARDASYPVRLSIEVKRQGRRAAAPLTEIVEILLARLEEHGLEERAIIQSFDREALQLVRDRDPTMRRSYLVRRPSRYRRVLDDDLGTILSPRFSSLRQRDVKRFQELGIAVIPWTLNEPDDIRRAISWGVDGLISDYPDRVLAILQGGS